MKIYERFKFGIFDCDGTLIKTSDSYNNSFSVKLMLVSFKKLVPLFALSKLEYLVVKCLDLIGRRTKYLLYPNAREVLETLRNGHLLLFISSASQKKLLERKLCNCGIYHHFSCILGAPKGTRHVEYFSNFFPKKQKFFERTFFVGDELNDMRIAKSCELYAIGITNSHSAEKLKKAGADVVINKIEELLELELV